VGPLLGCDGQQYVSPSTALLSVTGNKTGSKLVSQCNYVPVLLGSEVDGHYAVDGALRVSIALTRDDIIVTFQDGTQAFTPARLATKDLQAGGPLDAGAPAGYTAELTSGCVVDEP
jgi:hypothetical protein